MITIDEIKDRMEKGTQEEGLYTSVDEDGKTVIVTIGKNPKEGFRISYSQDNGWTRDINYVCMEKVGEWDVFEEFHR